MPIYAYKCGSCCHAKDVLQKISDDPLTDCPDCGQSSFSKQLTAPGFQLKGTGWYATDFKSSGANAATATATEATPATSEASTAAPASSDGAAPAASTPSVTPATTTSASGGCGTSCACH
ncbi:MAG: zinc ribbon domain-containing protein [Limnohabitans sp.]|nr:zinc ribbon domain-containing protein [Limnohabitans sp.]